MSLWPTPREPSWDPACGPAGPGHCLKNEPSEWGAAFPCQEPTQGVSRWLPASFLLGPKVHTNLDVSRAGWFQPSPPGLGPHQVEASGTDMGASITTRVHGCGSCSERCQQVCSVAQSGLRRNQQEMADGLEGTGWGQQLKGLGVASRLLRPSPPPQGGLQGADLSSNVSQRVFRTTHMLQGGPRSPSNCQSPPVVKTAHIGAPLLSPHT